MVARDEGVAPRTLRSAKAAATREEHARVYDGMNLPAEDIVVAWQGRVYVRRAWNGLHAFGWSRWQGAANA
jgi:hypothetical protein